MAYKILIADDEADTLEVLNKHLTESGYDVITAGDGQAALKKIRENNPDIILLDVIMPKMNGFEVLKELRNNPASKKWQPVIIISVKDEFDSLRKGYNLEADFYITKPLSLEKVSKAIQTMISLLPVRRTEEK